MMTLAERIHLRIIKDHATRRRLDGVPPAVVEDVLRLGIEALVAIVPMETLAHALAEIDFEACEVCGHLIDPEELEGADRDEEWVWLCNACVVEIAAGTGTTTDGSGETR